MKKVLGAGVALSLLMLLALPAFSQTLTGNITARAQDSTGAVIPGVEVSISSPEMIGGVRKEVTDETGSYRFTLLPPGTYRVSFALPGFKTLNIDGVLITGGSTATTVGTMEVAATTEEITITSQAPTIDLESATVGVNISQKMMDDIPWSRSLTGMSMMIPGVYSTSFDIGNSSFGTSSTIAARSGGRSGGNVVTIDGLVWCQTYSDYGSFSEMNVSTNAKGADQMNSGITLAMVVKNGGNDYHGNFTAKYQNGSMQSDNISQQLIDQGYGVSSNKYTHFDDFYGDIGGPILKDKLWFYGAYRQGYQGQFIPGFRTAVGGPYTDFYTQLKAPSAKLTYQLTSKQKLEAYVSLPDKFQPFRGGNRKQPKEATQDQDSWSSQGPMLTYTNIINSKMSLRAQIARGGYWWPAYTYGFNGPGFEGLGPTIFANGRFQRIPTLDWLGVKNVGVHISDTTSSAVDGAYNSNYGRPIRWQESVDLSRFANIRGKNHELKVGYMGWWDKDYTSNFGYPHYQSYIYRSTAADVCPNDEICNEWFKTPYRVTVSDHPNKAADGALYRSAYVNDKLTWNRKLTVNVGLRWDWAGSFLPPQGNDGSGPYSQRFFIEKRQNYIQNPVVDINTGKVTGVGDKVEFPTYTLWSPRLSFAYDVLGDGKIAIKGSYGRYVGITSGVNSTPGPGENSNGVNPVSTNSCTYNNWDGTIPFDVSRKAGPDGIPLTADDLDLNGSCGKIAFFNGQGVPLNIYHFDPNLKPDYVSEYTAGLEIGFSRDYALRVSIQRKFERNGNRTINVNTPFSSYTDVTTADDPGRDGLFCSGSGFSAPGAKTLPCTSGANYDSDNNPHGRLVYYSVPTSFAGRTLTNTLFKAADANTHEGADSFTAYTVTFSKNMSHGFQYVASYDVDLAHSVPNNPDHPNQLFENQFLDPITWSNSFKLSGTYSVPAIPLFIKGFKLAGVQYASAFVTQNGSWYDRTAQVNDIRGSAQNIVIERHVGRFPRLSNWDQSIRKSFRITERQRLEFTWELYNSLNANTVRGFSSTTVNNSSYLQPDGKTPLRPNSILAPRIYQWGVAYKF